MDEIKPSVKKTINALKIIDEMSEKGGSPDQAMRRAGVNINNSHRAASIIDAIPASRVMQIALAETGMDAMYVARKLKAIMSQKSVKVDKNGVAHKYIDPSHVLKAIEMWGKFTGALGPVKDIPKTPTIPQSIKDIPLND